MLEKGQVATMYHAGSDSYAEVWVLRPMTHAEVQAESYACEDNALEANEIVQAEQAQLSRLTKALDEAINKFDYETVRTVMQRLDWKWWDTGDVPSVDRMKQMLHELGGIVINEVIKGKRYSVTSGGFHVDGTTRDDGSCHFCLAFVVTDFSFDVK